ncbi:hypothetical protein V8G54_021332 [Vigna mungo]|uniref:Uncharacterized protein n=1 Tax=Vigna mungo TaxID=3915 RepID=A0AAQ3NFC0_VIGMU
MIYKRKYKTGVSHYLWFLPYCCHHPPSPTVVGAVTRAYNLQCISIFSVNHSHCERLHKRASPPLPMPTTIVILAGAQAAAMEERVSQRRGCQVGEGRLLSLCQRNQNPI